MQKTADRRSTTACPACRPAIRLSSEDVAASASAVAAEIARGGDLGGIIELASALVRARTETAIGTTPDSMEAAQAAALVIIKLGRVVDEFRRLGVVFPSSSLCPACEIRRRLDPLISVAATAAARRELAIAEGEDVPEKDDLVEAVETLARYAGDTHPDAAATRDVLSLAIDVLACAAARR
jgi:hypothetical protein